LIEGTIMNRRRFLQLSGAAATAPALCSTAGAQAYPTRPVHLIVGFPAGGGTDAVARLMGQSLSPRLGQPIVIDNRPGANTNLASEAVAKAAPDGHTLLLVGSPQAVNATLYDKPTVNVVQDIAPVASIARGTYVIVVNPSFPTKTVPELVAYAKANPGKINMASAGVGNPTHLAGELLQMMAGITMLHVPYRGDAPALTDLLGGQVQLYFSTLGGAIEHVRAGRLRALAVTAATRSEAMPDIPTVAEFIPGYEASGFWGIGAPKNTPAEVIEMLNKEINASLADPSLKARFSELGVMAFPLSAAEFRQFIAVETDKWGKVVKFAGVKPG
jgi:tripartite-type tricarboxylate transporter receptor subunit TctC